MLQCAPPSGTWRLINYRTAADVVTAEFLHDLYNRHRPEVNSYRFRNTICVYHGIEFASYAPLEEWDRLATTLGSRYMNMDPDLLDQTRRHLAYDKPRLSALMERIEDQHLPDDPAELAHLLMSVHYTSLSEIYGINLVQIEHALTWALQSGLEASYGRERGEQMLAQLVLSGEPTMASLDQRELLALSLAVTRQELSLDDAAAHYAERYGGLYRAYGALEEVCPRERLTKLCAESMPIRERRLRELSRCAQLPALLSRLSRDHPDLVQLGRLAADVGATRDRNKALMGRVAGQRSRILEHVCAVTGISRTDLSRYLLAELVDLLVLGRPLAPAEIIARWEPLVFQRQERVWQGEEAERLTAMIAGAPAGDRGLAGLPASPGRATGRVRRVRTRTDALAVEPGDIMVAFGTDFDLMDGLRTCAGIITEEGGLLSHASVIARELHKPCLIGVRGAMTQLSDGAIVALDAEAGRVLVLEVAATAHSPDGLLPLDAAVASDVAGQKATALARALRAGFPVLPGVVVPVHTAGSQLTRELAVSVLKALPAPGTGPELVIVRSSSPAEDRSGRSAAGIFASHVARAEPEALLRAMARVVSSASGQRARDYFGGRPPMALLVQPCLHQKLGGVAFSRHPVTGANSVWIEASGQGAQAVVSGRPDQRLEFERPVAGPAEDPLVRVAHLACQLEAHLRCPVDIEWGVDSEGLLWLFQVRPITTLREGVSRE